MERSEIIDAATGIAGGVLLVLAAVLFVFLPSDDPVPPTFQVEYVESVTEADLNEVMSFEEGQTDSFLLPVESESVHRMSFTVEWTDDIVASNPDLFHFRIVSPDGERITVPSVKVANDPANDTGQAPASYAAQTMVLTIEEPFQAPPRDGTVPGEHLEEDAANAQARLREGLVTYPAGDWELEIFLDTAGDCPSPQNDPARATSCEQETQGADDNGNDITILSASYSTYDVEVEEVIA